jgi:Fe2+ transport system protein B
MTNAIEPTKRMPPELRHSIPPAPIHPLAALATIVLDTVFGIFELIDPLALILTSVTVGVLGTISTTLIQHYLSKDEWGPSVAKGLVMGIIAGVPFQVTGTAVGAILLGWAGASQWIKLPGPKSKPETPSESDEIVDVEVKDVK